MEMLRRKELADLAAREKAQAKQEQLFEMKRGV